MNRYLTLLFGTGTWLVLAGVLSAHDTWIIPSSPTVSRGQTVSFDLTSGMAFPANEVGVRPDRLVKASIRLGAEVSDLEREAEGKKALRLGIRPSKGGVAAVWVESKPRDLELKPEQVREYLTEIGAWESVGKKWESEGKGRFRESYTKHAKTHVRVGDSEDAGWSQPVGMELELIAEKDPTRLTVGDEVTVQLLESGRPVPNLAIGLQAANQKKGSLTHTDSEGRAQILLDRGGWWLIRATKLAPSSKPDLDWETRFTTLTLHVGSK